MGSGKRELQLPERVAPNMLATWHRKILAGSAGVSNEGGDKSSSMPVSAELA